MWNANCEFDKGNYRVGTEKDVHYEFVAVFNGLEEVAVEFEFVLPFRAFGQVRTGGPSWHE
jgi:hypothetical protein